MTRLRRSYVLPTCLLAAGVVLVVAYRIASARKIGSIGQPSDIGGGLILLLGYAFVLAAVITGIVAARQRR